VGILPGGDELVLRQNLVRDESVCVQEAHACACSWRVCLCIYDIYARVHTVIDVDYWNTNLFIDQVLSS